MKKFKFSLILLLVTGLMVSFATEAMAGGIGFKEKEKRNAGQIAYDIVIIRPAGFLATVMGTTIFLVALPFAAISGNVEEVGRKTVKEPFLYTFNRPVGYFSSIKED